MLRNISSIPFTEEETKKIQKFVRKYLKELEKIGKESKREPSDWTQSTAKADEAAKKASEKAVIEALIKKSIRKLGSENAIFSLQDKFHANALPDILPPERKRKCKSTSEFVVRLEVDCDETSKYRAIDGYCNNLEHPAHGAAGIPMRRFAKTAYADGLHT